MLNSPEFRKKVQSHIESVAAEEESSRKTTANNKLAREEAEQKAKQRIADVIGLAGEVAVAANLASIPHSVHLSKSVHAGALRRAKQERITSGWKIFSSTTAPLIGQGYQATAEETTTEIVLGSDGSLYQYTHPGKSQGSEVSVAHASPVTVDESVRLARSSMEGFEASIERRVGQLESHLVQFVASSEPLAAQTGYKP